MKSIALCAVLLTTTTTQIDCGSDSATVVGTPDIVNRSSSALSAGVLQWANGTYGANCTSHANANWSLKITGGAVTMDNPALSVIQDNTGCVLTLTALVTNENTKTTYTATPAITLGAAYAASASTFDSGSGTAFYGNAKMLPADFSDNFTVTILYSDNPSLANGALTSVYASVTSSSATQSIASPNYSLDLNTGSLTVTVNNAFTVQNVTGTATLVASTVAGNSYYVDQGTLPASPTFAQLDAAYQGATTTAIAGGGDVTIDGAAFGLSAVSLNSTVYRTIVIQRVVSGVASYQTFRIGFSHP
jgi:hypothetical protein